jgi:hypothetical protein
VYGSPSHEEDEMGNWTLVIQGNGAHHNFKQPQPNKLVPDGEGDYERSCAGDADYLAAKFVRELKANVCDGERRRAR